MTNDETVKTLRAKADQAAETANQMRRIENWSDAEFYSGVHAGLLSAIKVIERAPGRITVRGHYRDGVWVEAHEKNLPTPADQDEFGRGLGEIDGGDE